MKKKIKKTNSKAKNSTKVRKKLHRKFNFQEGKIDKGSIFVVVFLIMLLWAGFILTGGVLPTKLPTSDYKSLIQVVLPDNEPTRSSLQMYSFNGVTVTPFSPQPDPQQPSCKMYLDIVDCGRQLTGKTDPGMIWAVALSATNASSDQLALQLFYNGARAMPLGSGSISPMVNLPADHVVNPNVGNNNRDANKFPFYPAVFITDITSNSGDSSGDAQNNGTPQKPTDVYGAWKPIEGPEPASANGVNVTTAGDAWPAANNPAAGGARDFNWSAEVLWKLNNLKTNKGQSLLVGHKYRVQFTIHNGNDTRDVAQVCGIFEMTKDRCDGIPEPTTPPPTVAYQAAAASATLCGQKSTPASSAFTCSGTTSSQIVASGYYAPTYFGCSAGYKDPGDNCLPACGSIPECNGVSGQACEEKIKWFAANADQYGCNAILKVTNPTTGKAVIVRAIDKGPHCSVQNAGPKFDLSKAAYDEIGAGSEVKVEKVADNTPLGPIPVCI